MELTRTNERLSLSKRARFKESNPSAFASRGESRNPLLSAQCVSLYQSTQKGNACTEKISAPENSHPSLQKQFQEKL